MALFGSIAMASPGEGSIFMILFGLGTIPLMTSAAYLGNVLKTPLKKRIQQLIPILVVVVGILFIIRGLGLGIPYLSPAPVSELITGSMECELP
jgi:sulfite exporter TauE/SafE